MKEYMEASKGGLFKDTDYTLTKSGSPCSVRYIPQFMASLEQEKDAHRVTDFWASKVALGLFAQYSRTHKRSVRDWGGFL